MRNHISSVKGTKGGKQETQLAQEKQENEFCCHISLEGNSSESFHKFNYSW